MISPAQDPLPAVVGGEPERGRDGGRVRYEVTDEQGPPHERCFEVAASVETRGDERGESLVVVVRDNGLGGVPVEVQNGGSLAGAPSRAAPA